MKQHVTAIMVALAMVVAACSAGGTSTITDDSVTASGQETVEPTVARIEQVEPTAPPVPTVAATEPTVTPVPPTPIPAPPELANSLGNFTAGECFNNVDPSENIPSDAVDCQGEHEYEVFLVGESTDGPDVPYRFDTEFTDGLFADFCDPATIEFAGASWDAVPFGVTVWTPSEDDWAAGDRSFACTAEAGLRSDNIYKVGTAAGGTLVSNEGIVARSTISSQRDFFFSFQGSTLYPLTDGSFELPNLSPQALSTGFLFAAPLQDVDGQTSRGYEYNFETGEVTAIQTGLDGWELASPHFAVDLPAFVTAARETETDDWDIYLSRSKDDVVALTDSPADDHWLTLTPDGSQIVYHSGGDIWIMNIDGSNKQQLTSDGAGNFESAVSPDGTQIVYASNRSGNDDIWIMNLDGSDQTNLTNHPGSEAWPFFSRDGSLIYFQTDRLGVRSNMMIMEPDGSNQSYYSFEFMTNGALLPDAVSERFASELPTIVEVLANTVQGVVGGAEGEFADLAHSSGRLVATLPSGWEYEEIAGDDPAALLTAPSISAYNTTWASDGARFTLIEAPSLDDFTARLDASAAANDSSCVEDANSTETAGARQVIERRYSCGQSSMALVVGVYENGAQLGMLVEGQWDGDPSDQADQDMLTAMAESLQWG